MHAHPILRRRNQSPFRITSPLPSSVRLASPTSASVASCTLLPLRYHRRRPDRSSPPARPIPPRPELESSLVGKIATRRSGPPPPVVIVFATYLPPLATGSRHCCCAPASAQPSDQSPRALRVDLVWRSGLVRSGPAPSRRVLPTTSPSRRLGPASLVAHATCRHSSRRFAVAAFASYRQSPTAPVTTTTAPATSLPQPDRFKAI